MALDLDKFQLLLNDLSNELSERNLQSLIHICGELIPGARQDNLTNGLQVFTILRHQNAIGDSPEKLKNLLKLMTELRPRRGDLASKVKRYIKQHYQEAETILNDVESSGEFSFRSSQPPKPIGFEDSYSGCLVRTGSFNCSCTRCCCDCCCCCAILAIVFLLLAVASALVWYTVPGLDNYRDNNAFVGPIVIISFGLLAVFFALGVGYHCFRRYCGVARYALLSDVNDSTSYQAVHDNSYAGSGVTRTSCETFPRKMYRSTSSGRMTASSSFASTVNSYPASIHPSTLETNGSLRQHNAFITEYEEDRESREEEALTTDGCHASLGNAESLNQQIYI